MPQPWEMDWSGVKVEAGSANDGDATKAKTYGEDRKAAMAARQLAAAERDAQQTYQALGQAVDTFDTGPSRASLFDAITPSPDDGWISGALKGTVGTAVRALIPDSVENARSHINTARAQLQVLGDKSLKGPLTDKDMALLRLKGVDTYKLPEENRRVIREAQRDSEVRQLRAIMSDRWISRFGSLTQASPNGTSFEDAMLGAEKDLIRNHWTPKPPARRSSLPKPPPAVTRKANGKPTRIDLNGNLIN